MNSINNVETDLFAGQVGFIFRLERQKRPE